jgi:hypothetical protein
MFYAIIIYFYNTTNLNLTNLIKSSILEILIILRLLHFINRNNFYKKINYKHNNL